MVKRKAIDKAIAIEKEEFGDEDQTLLAEDEEDYHIRMVDDDVLEDEDEYELDEADAEEPYKDFMDEEH